MTPSSPIISQVRESDANDESQNLAEFSDEEGYGRYLDMNECYDKFVNLKGIEKVDYLTYLATFDHLFDVPKDKKTSEYKKYIGALLDYFYDYVNRVKPLLDLRY